MKQRLESTFRHPLTVAMLGGFLLFAGIAMLGQILGAQKAERGTLSWELPNSSVTVIDTSGVCLYVFHSYQVGGIAAVSKAALPMGAGCQ